MENLENGGELPLKASPLVQRLIAAMLSIIALGGSVFITHLHGQQRDIQDALGEEVEARSEADYGIGNRLVRVETKLEAVEDAVREMRAEVTRKLDAILAASEVERKANRDRD